MATKSSSKSPSTKPESNSASKAAPSKKKAPSSPSAKPAAKASPSAKSKTAVTKKKSVASPAGASVKTSKPAASRSEAPATKRTAAKNEVSSASHKPLIPSSMARVESDADLLSEEQLRKFKSGLSKKDLQHYRQQLLAKRAEILGDVDSLQTDSRNKNESGDHFSPEHMADVGSEYWEQEFNMGLVESEQRLLREIVEAVVRIDKGIYGICMQTGEPIGKPRLDAKPWAKFCIAVAREKERRGIKLI